MTARSMDLARAVVRVAKAFEDVKRDGGQGIKIAVMGLAGTCHEEAANEAGVRFIAGEWPPMATVLSNGIDGYVW